MDDHRPTSWTTAGSTCDDTVFDVIGVGFGPSNVALAIALGEGSGRALTAHFFEKQPRFSWHPGMLLPEATMQVHFLKDLVTLRDPSSKFSFLNYLREQGRLVDFVNHKMIFPSRMEFHDYFRWCASACADKVTYGCEVLSVEPVGGVEGGRLLDVHLRQTDELGTRTLRRRTRNVVIAPGLRRRLPDGVAESSRVWHSSGLLQRLDGLPPGGEGLRFVVVGAGQSAAEVTAHLHGRFDGARVRAVFTPYGYAPADDSPFANRIFDPAAVDDFFGAPPAARKMLLERHKNTNYAVVDQELIEDLYATWYQEKVRGEQRLLIDNATRFLECDESQGTVRLTLESLITGEKTEVECDYLVCATGYHPAAPDELLGPDLRRLCRKGSLGQPRVGRDYRLEMLDGVECGIYVQGSTEHTHGLTSTLLSMTAVRAGEIADALRDRLHRAS
ncbi:lysine N(6)-hydroxylase/L-ornithine N(5)-oxygenase family protein [Streptomyces sp. NPDC014882]|uniref:lysine N(6)-hydroxylase/L-ornithine N(5)-oxygenase family protein n=1 Tax=Streptomyces sp. NPDC014882 TaxID=3364927 RepID=UPI0036FA3B51